MYYGKIKFFDSKKNNFGFITNIIGPDNSIIEDLYINGNDVLCSTSDLFEGTEVCFDIVGFKRKKAINLKLFSSLNFLSQLKFAFQFDSISFHSFLKLNIQHLNNLDLELKKKIFIKISSDPDTYNFSSLQILAALDNNLIIEDFFSKIINLKDCDKLKFINFDNKFIQYLINVWSFDSEDDSLKLFLLINKSEYIISFQPSFIDKFLEVSKDYKIETKIIFFCLADSFAHLSILIKNNFNIILKKFNDITNLLEIYCRFDTRKNIYSLLVDLLVASKWEIKISDAIKFISDLEKYFDIDYLSSITLNFISSAKLVDSDYFYELFILFNKYSNSCANDKFLVKKLNNLITILDDNKKLKLLPLLYGDFLNHLLNSWNGSDFIDTISLIELALSDEKFFDLSTSLSNLISKSLDLCLYKDLDKKLNSKILFNYIEKFNDKRVLKTITLALLSLHYKNFLLSIQCYNSDLIKHLIKTLLNDNPDRIFSDAIKVIYFFLDENYIPKIESFKSSIPLMSSSIQGLLFKRIIYLYFHKKISKNFLFHFFDINIWSSLNVCIVISFINNKPSNRADSLQLLSKIFTEHFSRFDKLEISEERFEDIFTISDFLNLCDGRKKIKYNLWEKNGIRRKYVNKFNFSLYEINNFYCEGRYWKVDKIYISGSQEYKNFNVYWCRGDVCYGINNKYDINSSYSVWGFLEIATIFNLKIDYLIIAILSGWANRINEIIHKLKCRVCNSILRPLPYNPLKLGYYSTSVFTCLNNYCSEYNKVIRITHCLNAKCGKILDSRDLKTCNNGWLICDNEDCKTCCPIHFPRKDYFDKFVEGYPIDDF